MRQLFIQVPRGHGQAVLDIAEAHNGVNLAQFEATGNDGPLDLVLVHLNNGKVEQLLEALEKLPDLHLTLIPRGVMPLHPPAAKASEQVIDVEKRSPIEIFLAGLQSVGSWPGFLGYAAAAGAVVWTGLFTNTIFLLIAAMLIAPFAGPAMNVAIATARGDAHLLRQSLLRYVVALSVTIIVAALFSLILQQDALTPLMIETSMVSSAAILLPLVAGAAGALNLVQSQRSSLVSGASIGVLVAASLAPPAGLIGMAGVLGRWDLVIDNFFVLLLQLAGINLAGAVVFRLSGLSSQGTRYQRGQTWVFRTALLITLVALAGLLTWQFWQSPELQRSSRSQRAVAEIQKLVKQDNLVELVEANVHFTGADIAGQNTLLGTVYVQRRANVAASNEEIRVQLTQAIQRHLLEQGFNVTPLIDVTVLEEPSAPGNRDR